MNFKRGRRKNARSGCLFCKSYKANGNKGRLNSQTFQERRSRISDQEQREEFFDETAGRFRRE